jgi:periplasmic protein TonB
MLAGKQISRGTGIITESTVVSMDTKTPGVPTPGAQPTPNEGPGVVATGWLAAQSVFEHQDERKMGRALGSSLVAHVGLFFLVIALLNIVPASQYLDPPSIKATMVYLPEPGPGGGGGGSPAPAPPKPMEIPPHKAPDPIPIVVPPPKVEPPPTPVLNAPVQTDMANVLQATGASSVSLASYGGGGSGGGIGPGKGDGVGPGEGGGTGGGVYHPGNGISSPTLLKSVEPKYTPDAMRAKIQGLVKLEVVVLKDGTVGAIRVIKSLDPGGLDVEAIKAARGWLFRAATDRDGNRVDVYVTLELEFRLH